MRRKKLNEDDEMNNNGMTGFTEWFVLQDTDSLKEAQFKDLKLREKKWVKEGICEECGAFDILSRYKGMFLCSECLKLINSNSKNKINKKQKQRKRKK